MSTSNDQMTNHYLVTALWSTADFGGRALEEKHGIHDVSSEFLEQAKADCQKLYGLIFDLLGEGEIDFEQLGHDFWLTRNRHGAGFWDGDYKNGGAITKIVHEYFSENDDSLRDSLPSSEVENEAD
jgi:hypothetical protein